MSDSTIIGLILSVVSGLVDAVKSGLDPVEAVRERLVANPRVSDEDLRKALELADEYTGDG